MDIGINTSCGICKAFDVEVDEWSQCVDRDSCNARMTRRADSTFTTCRICGASEDLDAEGLCADMKACGARSTLSFWDDASATGQDAPPKVESKPATVADLMSCAVVAYKDFVQKRRSSIFAYLQAGQHLAKAKEMAGHGEWGALLGESGIPESTARRMIKLHEIFGDDADAVVEAGGIVKALESAETRFTIYDMRTDGEKTDGERLATKGEMVGALDAMEGENRELRAENRELRKSKEDAPRKPSARERREAERMEMQYKMSEIIEQSQKKDERISFLESEISEIPAERESAFTSLSEQNATLRSQVAEWQAKYNDLIVRHREIVRLYDELRRGSK